METHHIYAKEPIINISRIPIKKFPETHQISPGHDQIYPGDGSNFSKTPIKSLHYHDQITRDHPSNISRTPIKYI